MSKLPFHVWSTEEDGRVTLHICRLGHTSQQEYEAPIQLEYGQVAVELSLGSMMRLLTDIASALRYRATTNAASDDH